MKMRDEAGEHRIAARHLVKRSEVQACRELAPDGVLNLLADRRSGGPAKNSNAQATVPPVFRHAVKR